MIKRLLTVILFPALVLWSLIYGVLGGIFFKTQAVYEHWIDLNRLQVIQWKRYPLRSYNKYTAAILSHRMRSKPIELVSLTDNQIRSEFRREPFPFLVILANTLIAIVMLPFAIISGVVQGPGFVYRKYWHIWQNTLSSKYSTSRREQ